MKKEYGALINGKWILNKNSIKVYNPSNGLVISNVPNINDSQIINAIDGAKKAFEKWSRISSKIRSDILKKFFHLVKENKNRLAKIITLESGKPLGES